MPSLNDVPVALRRAGAWTFAKRIWQQINEDNVLTWAAALAYSWLFAVFPFFLFLLTLVPYVVEKLPVTREQVIGQVSQFIQQNLPTTAAEPIVANVDAVISQPRQGLMSMGIILTLWAASGGMAMTMSALNVCYDVKETRPFYIQRPLAVLLTIVVTTLIIVVLILLPIGSAVTGWLVEGSSSAGVRQWLLAHGVDVAGPIRWFWNIARWSVSLLLMITIVNLIYHFAPRVKQKYHILTPGGVFTVVMWIILGLGFRFYIDRYGQYEQTYKAVSGAVVLLLIFYLDAALLLVGAEINSEMDFALLAEPLQPREPKVEPSLDMTEIAQEGRTTPPE